ncbi:MAG: hypothetical protein KDJ97_08915 [Anaerolineae bacterium]|nr:hypothetical protein [Anaerolineae bacterium]
MITAALSPLVLADRPWLNIALICPITMAPNRYGIVAMGEKRNGESFSFGEIALCNSLVRQLDTIEQIIHVRCSRTYYLEAAQMQENVLRGMEEKEITSNDQILNHWEYQDTPLAIRVLGPLQVFRQGELVSEMDWGSEKAKILLAYLLWKGSVGATRAEISEVLWPDRFVEETANVFHVTMHRLRRVLQPGGTGKQRNGYIQCKRKHYYFNADLPHWLDVTTFQQCIKSNHLPDINAAVELFRGPYLDGLTWLLPPEVEIQRRHFERLYVDGLRRLAAHTEGQQSVAYLEKLLLIEPTDEAAYSALVLGHLARGRRDLAQQHIARWQQALIEFEGELSPGIQSIWKKVDGKNGH